MTARVAAGARLHFGFQNLSLARERLYGGVGVALDEPRVVVEAEPAEGIRCDDDLAAEYAWTAVDLLGVDGAKIEVRDRLPRHVGLGSGTQFALATLTAIAGAYDVDPAVREHAPALGRGGRSGVGVAAFADGGFVVDGGHPTELFTAAPPADGQWSVPPVTARHELPESWRFVVVVPETSEGRSGQREDESMRAVVERADTGIADEVGGVLLRRVLPAAAEGDRETFGAGVAKLGRLNGAWYADEQGGVYRPPAGRIVDRLADCPAIAGAGQSSWGPAVYGVTQERGVDEAREAARDALGAAGVEGRVLVTAPRNRGVRVER
ncbi:beta-ribofuranosylaminobenzene 5'-phosphate synthase family protein [Halorientalis brevis]|uniref:Beta-ribofuranosylaminobenzene 5'-phosphate synthase n=1 Tax=Halorientalis brevis TaxID=1126241 RepID=A0ABD6C697_9EURY|nr:beta-ribofuranosylaminobenzene 5'-phosphate synthase family protein [Halorientalis brevis]